MTSYKQKLANSALQLEAYATFADVEPGEKSNLTEFCGASFIRALKYLAQETQTFINADTGRDDRDGIPIAFECIIKAAAALCAMNGMRISEFSKVRQIFQESWHNGGQMGAAVGIFHLHGFDASNGFPVYVSASKDSEILGNASDAGAAAVLFNERFGTNRTAQDVESVIRLGHIDGPNVMFLDLMDPNWHKVVAAWLPREEVQP